MSRYNYERAIRSYAVTVNQNIALLNGRKGMRAELFSPEPLYDMLKSSKNPGNLALRILRTLNRVGNALGKGHFINGEKGIIVESHWNKAFERLDALRCGEESGLMKPHRQWSSDQSNNSN
ncbi:hypothetical protein KKE38_02280 [Candidatus Micrarchaeota archaeon]|nr:hypothetical protein [Candidatus Micrarchaeota archaeon]MBU1681623.1 hypothetical protein [Candidatus Micrarchaeota archaeon]